MPRSSPLPARTPRLIRRTVGRYPLDQIEHGRSVLHLIASTRFATTTQVRRALFDRSSATERSARQLCTRTLRRLFDSGYLNRVEVFAPSAATDRLSPQIVHTLSAAGARTLGLDPRVVRRRAPKSLTVLSHDFWLVELAVLVLAGCPDSLTITAWWDDRVLTGRKRQGRLALPTVPDAFLVVRHATTGKVFPFLIELDLGTASVSARSIGRRDIGQKVNGYLDYLGATFRHDFEITAPLVILFVADTVVRRDHLQSTAKRLGAGGRFWFAALPHLRGQPPSDIASAGREGAFWASNWISGEDDGRRSLATRCGI